VGFWENQGEFVAAITSGGIDGTAVNAENLSEAADGAAADEMSVGVVYQAIALETALRASFLPYHGAGQTGN